MDARHGCHYYEVARWPDARHSPPDVSIRPLHEDSPICCAPDTVADVGCLRGFNDEFAVSFVQRNWMQPERNFGLRVQIEHAYVFMDRYVQGQDLLLLWFGHTEGEIQMQAVGRQVKGSWQREDAFVAQRDGWLRSKHRPATDRYIRATAVCE